MLPIAEVSFPLSLLMPLLVIVIETAFLMIIPSVFLSITLVLVVDILHHPVSRGFSG
jgi:hypothetical protein